jgi:uncharacterized protein YkwD
LILETGVLPKLVHVAFFAMALALALTLAQAAEGPDLPTVERLVIEGTNAFRREQGLDALAANAGLQRAARYFADYMARTDRYGHQADGAQPAERATGHGYAWCQVSENISYQYTSATFATAELAGRYVEGWKRSPGHRKNMVDRDDVHLAVAVARSRETGRYYAVQMFGRPRSMSIEFHVTNRTRERVGYRLGERSYSLDPRSTRVHQQCATEELSLPAAGTARGRTTARPKDGDRVEVVREAGGLALRGG